MTSAIRSDSRLLFFAPHPDDESLAAGGLLQQAVAAGAALAVVFATNGDNNPWPLRLLEKQWRITPADCALWGMRRMQEALEALSTLGLKPADAHFLGLPDQGLTALLLGERSRLVSRFRGIISRAGPTMVIAPAP